MIFVFLLMGFSFTVTAVVISPTGFSHIHFKIAPSLAEATIAA